jgi:C4-dicarboxylate transporter DctM subunit
MSNGLALVIVLVVLTILMALGTPIFISLGVSGLIGFYLIMGVRGLFQLPSSIFTQLNSFILVAIPLFILMGELIFATGIGHDIFDSFSKWLNKIPGGLAVASIYSSALFGAMCGVSIAGVAAIGSMAIPEMLDRRYDKSLAAGAIAASGALAVLIPPSISFILYGSLSGVSVGKLFTGGIVPGLVLATMMAAYVLIKVRMNPELAPIEFSHVSWRERIVSLLRLWPVILLILFVLGTIYTGVSTPTESAAIGVAGALLIGIFSKRLDWKGFKSALWKSTRISGSLLIILASAYTLSQFLDVIRVPDKVAMWATSLHVPGLWIILIFMVLLLILGCFIDGASLIIVTTPILLPTVIDLGFSPLWFGILVVLNVEIAVITPPVGLNLYTLKSITDRIDLSEILKGTFPYVFIDFASLILFMLVPKLALWLPSTMK